MISFLAFLSRIGLGGIINKTIGYMEKKAELEGEQDKLRSDIAIAHMKAAIDETRIMADLNKSKLEHRIFWWFLALFIVPLGIWWTAVLADSLFYFDWDVAALPAPLDQWAGDMIKWLFYVGSSVGGAAMVKGIFTR